jgi:hypothetical protein
MSLEFNRTTWQQFKIKIALFSPKLKTTKNEGITKAKQKQKHLSGFLLF